jgi:hypothetical protein
LNPKPRSATHFVERVVVCLAEVVGKSGAGVKTGQLPAKLEIKVTRRFDHGRRHVFEAG